MAYAVHQCVKLSDDIRKPHGEAVKTIGSNLKGTYKLGIYICPLNKDTEA